MATAAWFELVKFVSHVRRVANEGGKVERGQLG
jgi:hypothetical protein